MFVPDMGKLVDDHILDCLKWYFGKHGVETEPVGAAAASPLALGLAKGDGNRMYAHAFCPRFDQWQDNSLKLFSIESIKTFHEAIFVIVVIMKRKVPPVKIKQVALLGMLPEDQGIGLTQIVDFGRFIEGIKTSFFVCESLACPSDPFGFFDQDSLDLCFGEFGRADDQRALIIKAQIGVLEFGVDLMDVTREDIHRLIDALAMLKDDTLIDAAVFVVSDRGSVFDAVFVSV